MELNELLYVFDTSSLIVLSHYFPDRFPTFWNNLNECVSQGKIISVREVRNELPLGNTKDHLEKWISDNSNIFQIPTKEETEFVSKIFAVPRFLEIVRRKHLLEGRPVADPFVVAVAKVRRGCVVTEESERPNSARMPNVCEHFGVDCTTLEGFMKRESWSF